MDDDQQKQDEVIDAEIVESESTTTENTAVDTLLSLENLIKSHIRSLDTLRIELKKHRELEEDALNNDPTYKEHLKNVKEATKVKSNTKQQILKQPSMANVANKIKSMSSEIKEKENALSDYLKEYQRMSGASEIEGENGEVMEIVTVVKVVKRRKT